MSHNSPETLGRIAVVGMAGRYPCARDLDEFWENLRIGRDCITSFADEELIAEGIDPALVSRPDYVKAAGVLEGTYDFDAQFFSYAPREAELIDPQQRVFLECVWECIERAGYDVSRQSGRIGVFAGCGPTNYLHRLLASGEVWSVTDGFSLTTHNDKDFLTTRVAYKLDLRGPCVTVQTACSTSLVSIVLACQSLNAYACDLAVAGGVTLSVDERAGYVYRAGGVLSPNGRCRPFDASATGIVNGSGVGVVALKRLEDALADRDQIDAVILGFGLSNDGAGRAGFAAPGVDGQCSTYADALAMAGVSPETIGYVECHGTGTPMGDPIEIAALTTAFRQHTARKSFCVIGSVKSNIGHTDAASGVAGFTKTVLALRNEEIPPTIHFESPNPEIDIEKTPFYVNTATIPWRRSGQPRRAAVTALGLGGTNAHVILEEGPRRFPSIDRGRLRLLVWSARTESALCAASENLLQHLKRHPGENLSDVAYTLHVGRRAFPHRRALLCRDREHTIEMLERAHRDCGWSGVVRSAPTITFLFPGQGAQHPRMAAELYGTEPEFRETADLCATILKPELGLDIRELLFADSVAVADAAVKLRETQYAQPSLFLVEYALARLWIRWGVLPDAMIGHSLGEYVAACLAGVMELADCLGLVAARGRLMQGMARGAMLAVLASEQDLLSLLRAFPDVTVAAANAPAVSVLSGPVASISALKQQLSMRGISATVQHTSHAFHSRLMDPMLDDFRKCVERVQLRPPRIPFIANPTGTWITPSEATAPDYWVRHLRDTVRFADGINKLLENSSRLFLEVGPGSTLSSLVSTWRTKQPLRAVASLPKAKNDSRGDFECLMGAVGQLWTAGAGVDWNAFHQGELLGRVPLPSYPFERQRYKFAKPSKKVDVVKGRPAPIAESFYCPSWKRTAPTAALADAVGRRCIVFADTRGVGDAVAHVLRGRGASITLVRAGSSFSHPEPDEYTVRPGAREDYVKAIREMVLHGRGLTDVIHMYSLSTPRVSTDCLTRMEAAIDLTVVSLTSAAAALAESVPGAPIRIHVVSEGMHDVTGTEDLNPIVATLLGPCIVIPLEHPNLECKSVDIQLSCGTATAEAVNALAAEIISPGAPKVVAHRCGHRWARIFEPCQIPRPGDRSFLREGGVYLITGGLGGLGLTFARHIAAVCHGKLILTARSEFPSREHWNRIVDRPGDAELRARIRSMLDIEQSAGALRIFRADVSDTEQMSEVLSEAREAFGTIHGVIHAAGTADGRILQLATRAEIQSALAAKVRGALVLASLLSDTPVDFFVLCSSLTAIVGEAGQAGYTAANAFLDAFAASERRRGVPIVSVGWNGWLEVGMRARHQASVEAQNCENVITPSEGCDLLDRILADMRASHLVISRYYPGKDREGSGNSAILHDSDREPHGAVTQLPEHYVRPDLRTAYIPPRNRLEATICEIWQKALGVKQIGIADDFSELGGHSLIAIHVASQLQQSFGMPFSVADLYAAPTVAGVAEGLITRLLERASVEDSANIIREIAVRSLSGDESEGAIVGEMSARIAELSPDQVRRFCESTDRYAPTRLNNTGRHSTGYYSPIVVIRGRGSKPPLFFAEPAGGGVYGYHELVKYLDSDYPVYAAQRFVLGAIEAPPYLSIEELADGYIKGLEKEYGSAPGFLGGYSMGGIVAYEMARQLAASGRSTLAVLMVDSPARAAVKDKGIPCTAEDLMLIGTSLACRRGVKLNLSTEELNGFDLPQQLSLFAERIWKQKLTSARVEAKAWKAALDMLRNSYLAMQKYSPGPFDGPVVLIRAGQIPTGTSDSVLNAGDDPTLGWQASCAVPVTVHVLPSDHIQIMAEPWIRQVAEIITSSLSKSTAAVNAS